MSSISSASSLSDSIRKVPEKTKGGPVDGGPVGGELVDGGLVDVGVVDDAAIRYADAQVELTPALEKRLIWKSDLYICSIMCFLYAIQYMDKISNSSAAIMGLRTDLNMDGHMYSWVGSAFYLGYLVFEIPISFSLQRFPLAKTTAAIIVAWGIVLAASAASQNYAGFMVTRTLLGVFEGGITPAFLLITGQWYRREEHYSRVCIWFAWNGSGQIIGSAIAYGLYVNASSYAMAPWRILFLIFGLITIFMGVVFGLHVPDSPSDAWFLTEEEKAGQVSRIRDNKQGYGTKNIKWDQVQEAFLDPHTYLHFAIVFLMQVPNGGLTNFSSILYEGMGYTTEKSLELGMAQGATQLVALSVFGYLSLHVFRGYRMVYATFGAVLSFLSAALLAWAPSNSGKIAGIFIFSGFTPLGYICLLSNMSSNVSGSTKKSISAATLLIGYSVGNLVGPQTFKPSEAPTYETAKVAMAACTAVNVVLFVFLYILNVWINRRRDKKNEHLPGHLIHTEFADLTDMKNPEFRYAL